MADRAQWAGWSLASIPYGKEVNINNEAIGLQACEMLRIVPCQGSRLTGGGNVVIHTHRPRSTSQKHHFSASVLISVRG
jgi:hypothetical protein